ncbi:MAG: alanine/glycine:cation symporter family protein [Ghiorsea sp.]|nr:alanine/glycine:cation symporter family protein [Ghiorsea sp.]MDQ7057926.1 alanine/glycine:cation symporter family protein [Ghiorsea sp.]
MLMTSITPAFAAETNGVDSFFATMNDYLATVLFFDVFPGKAEFPFIVAWLSLGAIYMTFRFGFINLRMIGHAFDVIRGKYQSPEDKGEVTPFQALTTALSATVGLGNIAGVAIAIIIGGPGAIIWMIIAGFFGMSAKFTEVTLGQLYRHTRPDGRLMGGAMYYLSEGLKEKGLKGAGKALAIMFTIFCIAASLGGGNAFQVSQAMGAVQHEISFFNDYPWMFGIIMATLVGFVIIGGIKRIAHAAEAIVPTMVLIYVVTCLWIIFANISAMPEAFATIWHGAFSLEAGFGALVGVIVQGFKRAAFSSEAGIGSAVIAHSTAAVKYPVRQGIVALYEPFIDTIIICTMTALVIVVTGVYNDPEHIALVEAKQGAALTSVAFGSVVPWFSSILSLSVVLFAFSTMISWSYYGERCWTYLFGEKFSMVYKIMFLTFIILATLGSAGNILDFSDLLLLAMALPNFIGLYILQDKVGTALKDYLAKLKNGEFETK